jgi:hypothetical protein
VAAADFTYRIAETREDIEGAVRLVYRNYIELGYCHLNRFGVHFYLFDVLPETRTLVALHGDRVVATLTLVFDSPLGLPSGKLYAAELDALRSGGRRLVEVSKLAVDRDLGARGLAVLKGIFRLGWLASARVRGCTDFVIMVEPHHERFYARSLLFERAGELKPDPEAKDAPSLLLRLRLAEGPERYRAAFGEEPKEANPYWYFVQSPEVAVTEAAARAADGRLSEMNRLLETGRKLPSPTPAERRYLDYRLFSIAFVTDKTCKEAEKRARHSLFRDEIETYDRLLAALPPDYAPERRADIFIDIAKAAWYGGLYQRAVTLARAARQLAVGPGIKAASHCVAAMGLNHLGRGSEALGELREGLELPGISARDRGRLLQIDGRLAVDRFDLAAGRRCLDEAREAAAGLPRDPDDDRLRALIFHNRWVLEVKCGDLVAARDALRSGVPFLDSAGSALLMQYHQAWSRTEMAAGRPREALAHAEMGLRQIDPASAPFNAAVMVHARGEARLALGELEAAMRDSREEMELAASSKFPVVMVDALGQLVAVLAAEDRLADARREFETGLERIGDGLPMRAEVARLQALAYLGSLERDWPAAREHRAIGEKLTEDVPEYRAFAHCDRVRIELQAGDLPAARRLAAEMIPPETLRGFAVYGAEWKTAQAVLAAADGDEHRAAALAGEALAVYRSGEAVRDLAEAAILMAEALKSCRLAGKCPRLCELLRKAAAEVCASVRLPTCARRLRELQTG